MRNTSPPGPSAPDFWPVAVFAHNESDRIVASLDSIGRASRRKPVRAYVLINGCTDNTEEVVDRYASENPWVQPVKIKVGDKSNAWNVFVHEVVPEAEFVFFVDGDVRIEAGAFDELADAMRAEPSAWAGAAVPSSGRSLQHQISLVCDLRLLLGNLYVLRGSVIDLARSRGVRIPVGYIGDDALVTSLVKWDLDPTGPFVHERVLPCPRARFQFESFSILAPSDWKVYWRRRIRYSIRHFQHELLTPILQQQGNAGMPATVADLYRSSSQALRALQPRGGLGLDAITDRIALAKMRESLG